MALTRKINQKYIYIGYDIPKDIFIFWYTYRTLGEVMLERIVTRKGPLCIFACKVCTLEYILIGSFFSFSFVCFGFHLSRPYTFAGWDDSS